MAGANQLQHQSTLQNRKTTPNEPTDRCTLLCCRTEHLTKLGVASRSYVLVPDQMKTLLSNSCFGTCDKGEVNSKRFFRKRACIEARDHGEPSRAVKSSERRNGINGGGPRERNVDGGGGRLCRIRVTLDRVARRGLFPRGERLALGTRRHPRQDRKALRKPGFLLVHWAIEWIGTFRALFVVSFHQ
jgi:hypothetical protein